MNPLLKLQPCPSRLLAIYLLSLFLLAGFSIYLSGLSNTVKWLLAGSSLCVAVYNQWDIRSRHISELNIFPDGNGTLRVSDGPAIRVISIEAVLLLPQLTILRIHAASGSAHRLILLPDSLPAELLRQLRVVMHGVINHQHEARNCQE